jgi:hypothetical protein
VSLASLPKAVSNETIVWKTQHPDASNLAVLGELRDIRCREGEDSLRVWAGKFINTSGLFNREIQNDLKAFFDSTVARNPEERLTDWVYLIHLLQDSTVTAGYAASNRCTVHFTINHGIGCYHQSVRLNMNTLFTVIPRLVSLLYWEGAVSDQIKCVLGHKRYSSTLPFPLSREKIHF